METISFARGVPAPECLPVEELADCARAAVERDGRTILSYGSSAGYAPLREWIAERHGADPARVLLTNGSLQGFLFLAQRLAPGRRVLVERPTYDRPLKLLSALGADVVPLPMDEEGLDPDALEAALDEGPAPAFLYTIPTFQNPSGRTLSTERRRRVVELAADRGLLVLEDDPYGLVRFEGDAPPSLHALSGGASPTRRRSRRRSRRAPRRLLRAPAGARARARGGRDSAPTSPRLCSARRPSTNSSRRGRFEPNLERVRALLQARRDAMLAGLERHLPNAQ